MSITSRGKTWELLHSLWIGWTFTLGFFNWVAFLYIGFRARRKKWIAWGVLYSLSFVLVMILPDAQALKGWLGNVVILWTLVGGIASILHAFRVRSEYLLRLEARQTAQRAAVEMLRAGPYAQYSTGTRETTRDQKTQAAERAPESPARQMQPSPITATSPATPTNSVENATLPPFTTNSDTLPTPAAAPVSSVPARRADNLPREHASSSGVQPVGTTSDEHQIPTRRIDYAIPSTYPFPIAYGYRLLDSIVSPLDLYKEQLRVAENLLAFLGSVSLALLLEQDREATKIDPAEYWRAGISPGDWKDIIARCSKVFVTHKDNSLGMAIQRLNIGSEKKGFGADIALLISAKNDFKHDRGPSTEEDFSEASEVVRAALGRSMGALAFFASHPIRQVLDINVDRRGDRCLLKCLRYTGDHPGLPQEEITLSAPLHRGDLFIELADQTWVTLYPFLTARTCPRCKVRETYFIDKWDTRKAVVHVKSFERGHTEDTAEVSRALEEWKGS